MFTLYRLYIYCHTHIFRYALSPHELSTFELLESAGRHPKIYNHPRAENNFFMFHSFSPTTSSYSINFFDMENFLLRFSLLPHWKNFQYFRLMCCLSANIMNSNDAIFDYIYIFSGNVDKLNKFLKRRWKSAKSFQRCRDRSSGLCCFVVNKIPSWFWRAICHSQLWVELLCHITFRRKGKTFFLSHDIKHEICF